MPVSMSKYPILHGLLDAGEIALVDGEFVGRASDGVAVSIGYDFDPAAAERYLSEHSTPETW